MLSSFDHFVCCHNIIKLEARCNRCLQRTVDEHMVQISYASVAIGIRQVVDDEPTAVTMAIMAALASCPSTSMRTSQAA